MIASPQGINPLERLILLSADDEGRIPFFQWQAMGIAGNLKALTLMERMGYLSRESGTKFCRAFHLTDLGNALRAELCARKRQLQGDRSSGDARQGWTPDEGMTYEPSTTSRGF